MDFKGHVEKGWIKPAKPITLPDGTPVTFSRADSPGESKSKRKRRNVPSVRNWKSRELNDLVREQATKPLRSIDQLAGDWPKNESIDEFLKSVHKGRK